MLLEVLPFTIHFREMGSLWRKNKKSEAYMAWDFDEKVEPCM